MAAWRANAVLKKECDTVADQQMRSSASKLDRANALSSRALEWQQEADTAADARSQRKRTMSVYRYCAIAKVAKLEKGKKADESECKQLQADVNKVNLQLCTAST
eukprot:6189779-Pleurochrysis_carterae.AAC.1